MHAEAFDPIPRDTVTLRASRPSSSAVAQGGLVADWQHLIELRYTPEPDATPQRGRMLHLLSRIAGWPLLLGAYGVLARLLLT